VFIGGFTEYVRYPSIDVNHAHGGPTRDDADTSKAPKQIVLKIGVDLALNLCGNCGSECDLRRVIDYIDTI
jgi:hypothetical protein